MRKNAEFCSAIWLARGKNQNVSVKRAMTFVSLARTWSLLAHEKDELTAIEEEERRNRPPQLAAWDCPDHC